MTRVLLAWMLTGLLWGAGEAHGAQRAREVGLVEIDGAIGPATADYLARAAKLAGERRYEALVIRLDTPGGLLDSTKTIVQTFYQSPVPIVVFVGPSGANAGSAGVFITMAADVAAMAPNTSIGAAHPVAGGGGEMDEVMKEKMVNFATSYIEAIAEKRGRNAEWAKSAVAESKSITSEKALEENVIDLIAADIPELLKKIHGREVQERKLTTANARVVEIPRNLGERVFQVLWRPEVMMILMLVAIYGLIGELSNPGAILPGVVGAIALILVLYMSAILPVNIAGLALIGLAVALFVIDIFTPTHGVLTVGGVVSLFLGFVMLFNRGGEPAWRLSMFYIIPATLLTAAFFIFIIGAGLKAQTRPVRAGKETMLGQVVSALDRIDRAGGKVFIEGEYWNAVSEQPIEQGQPVEVVAVQGLTLRVRPAVSTQPTASL
jgi:membrane-bound serine protease (ClpP class)